MAIDYSHWMVIRKSKLKDLKRIQKEIDEAVLKQNDLVVKGWGNSVQDESAFKEFNDCAGIIETNQEKIKQIIESL
jgi:hypothetical protein